jgi:type IV pilus assembly protein PilC
LIFIKWASTASGKRTLDSLAVNVPLIGLLNKRMITAKFANTLSMLITAGLPMLQAMEITGKVVSNYLASLEIQESISKLRTGSTLYESMLGSKIHPPLLYNMINIGEETGELDDMLTKVGIYFDEEVDNLVDQVTTFIEPIMTLILAVVVLVLIMAIVLPMFTMAQAVM